MKILKHGKLPTEDVICPHCGAELRYCRKDILSGYTCGDNGYGPFWYVVCPDCGEMIEAKDPVLWER